MSATARARTTETTRVGIGMGLCTSVNAMGCRAAEVAKDIVEEWLLVGGE